MTEEQRSSQSSQTPGNDPGGGRESAAERLRRLIASSEEGMPPEADSARSSDKNIAQDAGAPSQTTSLLDWSQKIDAQSTSQPASPEPVESVPLNPPIEIDAIESPEDILKALDELTNLNPSKDNKIPDIGTSASPAGQNNPLESSGLSSESTDANLSEKQVAEMQTDSKDEERIKSTSPSESASAEIISEQEKPAIQPEPPSHAGEKGSQSEFTRVSLASEVLPKPDASTEPPGQSVQELDAQLPKRVAEVDPNATMVSPAAYLSSNEVTPPGGSRFTGQSNPVQAASSGIQPARQGARPQQSRPSSSRTSPQASPQASPQTSRPSSRQTSSQINRQVTPQSSSQSRLASVPIPRVAQSAPRPVSSQSAYVPPGGSAQRYSRSSGFNWRKSAGCLLRITIVLAFIGVVIFIGVGSWLVYQYYTIRATLPPVTNLDKETSQFETTRILDRTGKPLYEIYDPTAGKRTYVPLSKISPYLIAATISTEDKEFYNHPGYDFLAMLRALWQNYTNQEIVSGASTITQQLARALLLSEEERYNKSYYRKAREIVLAAELTRVYSKEKILEIYLNENFYGSFSYGIEAAAQTYFQVSAEKLTLSQGSFLAGLPQAPAVYDIFTNRDETLRRHKQVLALLYENSRESNCVYVSTMVERVCVSDSDVARAAQEIEKYTFKPAQNKMVYPHWVTYIRSILETRYEPQVIYRSGFQVYTTIDPTLQEMAEKIVAEQVSAVAKQKVSNGALIAIRPATGEILAMVGSADFYKASISGQVNMALAPRQPGSAMKPFTYVAAFEKGWTPATVIWDVPSEFPPSGDPKDTRPPYIPQNYDGIFHGPMTVRVALANSYNIPAVKALQFVGVYDNPAIPGDDGLINLTRRLGITSLTRNDYGLSLTLGGGEVSLLEMVSAYSVFANLGRKIPPVAITKIVDRNGKVVFDYKFPSGEQVIRADHAYLITSILSDVEARAPNFGAIKYMNMPFDNAWKTGTTNDFRDNWTIGYTPDLAVGVWVGNADYTPMATISGIEGAGPIWSSFIAKAVPAVTGSNPKSFVKPATIVQKTVCAISGTEPSEWCPSQKPEIFANDQLPLSKEYDFWKKIQVDTWTGLIGSPECEEYLGNKFILNVKDATAIKWIKDTKEGQAWAKKIGFSDTIFFTPERECRLSDSRPNLQFLTLTEGQTINASPVEMYIIADATRDFKQYRIEWGIGDDPSQWKSLLGPSTTPARNPEKVLTWDLKDIPQGRITLRLYMDSTKGTYAEKRIHVMVQVPTATPTATITVTPTRTATSTYTPTSTRTITPTPTITLTPSSTNTPSPTLTPTESPAPTASPTSGP